MQELIRLQEGLPKAVKKELNGNEGIKAFREFPCSFVVEWRGVGSHLVCYGIFSSFLEVWKTQNHYRRRYTLDRYMRESNNERA